MAVILVFPYCETETGTSKFLVEISEMMVNFRNFHSVTVQ